MGTETISYLLYSLWVEFDDAVSAHPLSGRIFGATVPQRCINQDVYTIRVHVMLEEINESKWYDMEFSTIELLRNNTILSIEVMLKKKLDEVQSRVTFDINSHMD